ncbi:DNA recombination protein RmuC [Microlunatus speluncae]|uniref:DNA recombination protein RmuC n=1 Tax=Microlunatus speluncae TaxID=2594267 RepID=UPI0014781AC8|nr:DNA recombination protein RmuC [Microlunatus speluncae]
MDVTAVVAMLAGLVIGLGIGAAVAGIVIRSRQETAEAREDGRARTELSQAQTLAAEARSESSQSRSELSQARADVAEARALASAAQAEAAEVGAQVAKAVAERDAAIGRAKELAADREAMLNQFKVLSGETIEKQSKYAEASADARLKATEQLMAPVRESLDRFNLRLTEVEKERVRLSADLRQQVQSVQLTGENLRRETHALATALRKPHVRGAWGELQLKRVAELAGMIEHCDFTTQHTTSSNDRAVRPDMRVDLAEGKCVFVDAKVPLSAFLDAHETDDPDQRSHALQRFAQHVRTHIDQLSAKKYWQADAGTPEFVVLFLASEALAAEAFRLAPDLHEYASRRDVVLATPTTLIAMLRAVAYGWKQAKLAENAAEVLQLGRDLHERLGTMGNRLDKLGRALRTSVTAYNDTIATVEGRVFVKARQFTDLKVTDQELTALTSVDDPVRQIQAPELVEDAAQVEPIIGRTRRRAKTDTVPEAEELVRSEPDLFELIESELPAPDEKRDTGS